MQNRFKEIKNLVLDVKFQTRFEQLLGAKKESFISSALQTVSSNPKLQECEPQTILNAVVTAAILDLPINPNFGFAWVVPYKGKAQFQMGWKGFVQLAQRSREYQKIISIPVYENQFESWNPLTETLFGNFELEGEGKVVGYASYFKLLNGFEKMTFWRTAKVEAHAKKFSKTFNFGNSVWKTDFNSMAMKTVLKNTLSKYGPLSLQMQTAIQADQSIQEAEGKFEFPDNPNGGGLNPEKVSEDKEKNRLIEAISSAKTAEELKKYESPASALGLAEVYLSKLNSLTNKKSE